MGSFAGLLAVLFGPGCDYYTDVFGARMILADEGVAVLADRFTPLLLRQYVWTFIDKGRHYFHQVLVPEDFESGRTIAWPKSGLKDVLWKI